MARTGRRPGATESRAAILDAARRLFGEKGYDATTIRGIARESGVDPALVHHFFGAKEHVFVAAMEFPFDPAESLPHVLAGDPEEIGERLVRFFLSVWNDPASRDPFLATVRSAATHEHAAATLREFVSSALVSRVADAAGRSKLQVEAAAAQLMGLALLRYIVRVEPLASADEDTVVAMVAPTIQRYLANAGDAYGP